MMPKIEPVNPANASHKQKHLLDRVQAKLGGIPNLMTTLAHSPAALESYLTTLELLSGGSLPAKLREAIAILVAQINNCEYCLSAHTFLGLRAGLDGRDAKAARRAESSDAKHAAALRFARELVVNRGEVGAEMLDFVRNAGYGDAEIVEIVSHVAVNTLTNYLNNVAGTEVDFPRIPMAFQDGAATR